MKTTFTIEVAKIEETVDVTWADLSEAMQEGVVAYGLRQLINDAHASVTLKGKTGPEEASARAEVRALALKRLDNLRAGTHRFGAGGGGAPISEVEREARAVVRALLVSRGMPAGDADKAAKHPRDVVRGLAEAKAAGDAAMATRLFEENWARIEAAAEAAVAAKKLDLVF